MEFSCLCNSLSVDLQRQDLRKGQPQQLRGGRGERHRVQHQDGLQRPGVQRQEEGAGGLQQRGHHPTPRFNCHQVSDFIIKSRILARYF